ncbi:MAG: hypothetical protein ACR2IP_09565 [Solirubrobacteraceae bacterium]
MRASKVATVLAILVATAALAGCGSSTVSPGAYVKSFCTAIGPFQRGFQDRESALKVSLSQASTAAQSKSVFQGFLAALASDTSHVVTRLKAAGTPKVASGKMIASGIVNAFAKLQGALSRAASQARSLPTTSLAAFKAAAQPVAAGVGSSTTGLTTSLSAPELAKVEASEPACQLSSSG